MRCHQGAKSKQFDISDVILHKFSHGAASYTINGENVNVMLESYFISSVIRYQKFNPFKSLFYCFFSHSRELFPDNIRQK